MVDDAATAPYDTILVERRGRVGLLTLNRPKALNALNRQVMHEVTRAAAAFDADPDIGCLLLTGSEKAFRGGGRHQGNGSRQRNGHVPRRRFRGLGRIAARA